MQVNALYNAEQITFPSEIMLFKFPNVRKFQKYYRFKIGSPLPEEEREKGRKISGKTSGKTRPNNYWSSHRTSSNNTFR